MAFTPEEEAKIKRFIDMVTQSSPGGGTGGTQLGTGNTLLQSLRTQAERLSRINSVTQATGTVLEGLGTSAKNAAVSLTTQLGKSITQLADGIMSDALGFRTAGNFMKNMIGLVTTAFTAMTDVVGSVGKALGSLPNKFIAGAGLAIEALGKVAATAASVLGQMASVVVDIVVQSMEGLANTFFAVSKAGGVFGGGMNDLAEMAKSAGLSVGAFGKLITENSEALARSGLSISGATRVAARILTTGGEQLKSSLFSLGFNLDEQAGVVAQAMANMTAAGDPFRANTPETIEATTELAKNMRLMANYTGEDLKRKQEEANQYKKYLTLQRVLLNMEPTQRQNFMQKFSLLTEQEKKNALDVMEFGQIINKTGAAMAGTNSEYASYQRGLIDSLMNSNTNLEQFERERAAVLPGLIQGMAQDRTFAAAQVAGIGGVAGSVAQGLGDIGYLLGNRTLFGLENAAKDINQAGKGATGLTETTFIAAKAMMDFKIKLEQEAFKLAPKFNELFESMGRLIEQITPIAVSAFEQFTDLIKKSLPYLEQLAKEVPKSVSDLTPKMPSLGDVAGAIPGFGGIGDSRSLSEAITRGAFAGLGTIGGGLLGGFLRKGTAGAIAGSAAGGYGAEYLGDLIFGKLPGRAYGGPTDQYKPYLVGEMGKPELFVPETSGKVVPSGQLVAVQDQEFKNLVKDQNMLLKKNYEQSMEMLKVLTDMKFQDTRYYNSVA